MVSTQVSMILLTTVKHQTLLYYDQMWFHCQSQTTVKPRLIVMQQLWIFYSG